MFARTGVFLLLACSLNGQIQAQQTTPPVVPSAEPRVVISSAPSSETVIAIPPVTSWRLTQLSNKSPSLDPTEMAKWLHSQSELNGLQSDDIHPWHIVVDYDQYDEDGDNVHSGVIEEFWAGPQKYTISYKGDTLNQTDYATDHGLFRLGDQRWPNRVETQALAEIADPFFYLSNLYNFHTTIQDRTFGKHSLHCIVLERNGGVSIPIQYCFTTGSSALRYVRGEGWFQTVYNNIVSIDGRSLGRDVEVTDAGRPFLKLHVKAIELLSSISESNFTPPANAVDLTGKLVTGVTPTPIQTASPEWPPSLRSQHFAVTVDIVIGTNGLVKSAHAISGPQKAYKAAEKTASNWIFAPFLVVGKPAEMAAAIVLSNN